MKNSRGPYICCLILLSSCNCKHKIYCGCIMINNLGLKTVYFFYQANTKKANFPQWAWHKIWWEQCGVFRQILRNLSQDVPDEWILRSRECPLDQNASELFQTDRTEGQHHGHCQDEEEIKTTATATTVKTILIRKWSEREDAYPLLSGESPPSLLC